MENAKKMAAMLMSKLEGLDLDKIKGINIGIMMSDKESDSPCDDNPSDDFEAHKMYDSDGKEYDADTEDDHKRMKKMGYTHKEDNDAK
jgi:hypothetical protein